MAQQAGLAQRGRSVLQAVTHQACSAASLSNFGCSDLNALVKLSRSLLLSSIFWTSSGSCPLCLTPPCYHFEPPATAALFLSVSEHRSRGAGIASGRNMLDRSRTSGQLYGPRGADRHMAACSGVRRSVMSEKSAQREPSRCRSAQRLASSQAFCRAVSRRHGAGRGDRELSRRCRAAQESKKLERAAALAYATESMRLTTRLMQLASWLLLHRAVKEGEMSLAQANKEKTKVKLVGRRRRRSEMRSQLLPRTLRDLIERSRQAAGARCGGSTPPSTPPVADERRCRQSGRAPARPAEGRVRARRR